MALSKTIQHYSEHAQEFSAGYEMLSAEIVHQQVLDLMPGRGSAVLDIGAGSGRDAAWFAQRGSDVVAVDPASGMLKQAQNAHPEPQIHWVQDSLPSLTEIVKLGLSFDLILLSAVWMHIRPTDKPRAFRKITSLLRPGGKLIISIRSGGFVDGRESFPTNTDELEKLGRDHGLLVLRICKSSDLRNRAEISWQTICFEMPDDGTEALPLLRHIIINDSKSSTYKLALLRVLVRIADSSAGMAKHNDDETVAIPLGLVALYWLRAYKLLVELGIPQRPDDVSQKGLSFVKEAFLNLKHLSPYDLRIGAIYTGADAANLQMALMHAAQTVRKQPSTYITYPNSNEQIFKTYSSGRLLKLNSFTLTESYLSSFGILTMPRNLWRSMSRFASWVEPALLGEWVRLMQQYSLETQTPNSYDFLMQALKWIDPERDTNFVRKLADNMFKRGESVLCAWSGRRLQSDAYDIDHCFPFAAWPCGDLWNLLPSARAINQNHKRDKLISAKTLDASKERIVEWWQTAYLADPSLNLERRFLSEASASLPIQNSESLSDFGTLVFNGVALKRATLKSNMQLEEWEM